MTVSVKNIFKKCKTITDLVKKKTLRVRHKKPTSVTPKKYI